MYFSSFDEVRENLKGFQPLGRGGEVEEMAALAAFIVSDENSFMTGSTIVSDGGFQVAARPPSKGE